MVANLAKYLGDGFAGITTKKSKKPHKHSTKCKCHKKKK